MKTIYLALLLSLGFVSCKKDTPNSVNLKLELIAENNVTGTSSLTNTNNVVAVLNVKSYNAKTGEIIFNNEIPDNVGEWKDHKFKVNVYYNQDAYLFSLTSANPTMSFLFNEPVLYQNLTTTGKKEWYILSGYPNGKVVDEQSITDAEQLKAFLKIKANWDIFVEELKKSGKYIN